MKNKKKPFDGLLFVAILTIASLVTNHLTVTTYQYKLARITCQHIIFIV